MIDNTAVLYLCNIFRCSFKELSDYLNRLEEIEKIANSSQYNGISHLKNMYYRKYLINPLDIPKDYLYGNFGEKYIDIGIEDIITFQKCSLDMWLDYLLCKDVVYPEWFKFFVFQGVIKIGAYDEVREKYNKRTKSTIAPFIEIDYEVIAFIYNNLCNYLIGNKLDDIYLEELIKRGNFNKLYNYCEKKVEFKNVKSLDDLEKIREIDEKIENLNKKLRVLEIEKRGARGDRIQYFKEIYYEVLNDIYKLKDIKFNLVSLVKFNDNIELRKSSQNKDNYGIYIRNTYEYVGEISYRKFHVSGYLGDVGYSINQEFRGNGYAYQALELLGEKLYEDNIPDFIISVLEKNIASKKIIEKYGGQLISKEGNVLIYSCKTRFCKDSVKMMK